MSALKDYCYTQIMGTTIDHIQNTISLKLKQHNSYFLYGVGEIINKQASTKSSDGNAGNKKKTKRKIRSLPT
jgi:hypothetical protein